MQEAQQTTIQNRNPIFMVFSRLIKL